MSLLKNITYELTNYNNNESFGAKLRAKRIVPLLSLIKTIYKKKGRVWIADIGGTERYWNIIPTAFLRKYSVEITIINLPGMHTKNPHGPFHFVEADACDLTCFDDKYFDIAHSNSVIEHVGDWAQIVKYSMELKRIADNYFMQTPNFWFPIEPHYMTPFFHWLPKTIRIWLVMHFDLGNRSKAKTVEQAVRSVDSVRLLNKKLLNELFPDAGILTERLFLLPKSFVVFNRNENL